MIRVPQTNNNTLQAWNASDELLIEYSNPKAEHILIFNDRFGYLTKNSKGENKCTYVMYKSQLDAIILNCQNIDFNTILFPNQPSQCYDEILIHAPKSLELLEFYIQISSAKLKEKGVVHIGFMTRHFSKKIMEFGETYFKEVLQSKAKKKARVISLRYPRKEINKLNPQPIKKINTNDFVVEGYVGTFSTDRIDNATQFLLDNLNINPETRCILDLGSGNGALALKCRKLAPKSIIHLMDDSLSAHLSGQKNLDNESVFHHWHYNLDNFDDEYYDLVISNPPFHFEHEIDLSIPFSLLKQSIHKLKKGGTLLIVANNHINYPKVIDPLVSYSTILNKNKKYYIYQAVK